MITVIFIWWGWCYCQFLCRRHAIVYFSGIWLLAIMWLILWELRTITMTKNVFWSTSCTPCVFCCTDYLSAPHWNRPGSFHPGNKLQSHNWQPASLDVSWNKCILICAETWLRKADLQPNSTSELCGGTCFFSSSVFFFSFPAWQAHFSSLSGTGAGGGIITLHYITEHSIMGLSPTAFTLVAVSITDGALLRKVLKAHKFCMFNKSTFCVWCLAVCCGYAANIFRAPYQHRSAVYTKSVKASTVIDWVRTLLFRVFVSSAHPSVHSRQSGHGSLNTLKIAYYVRRTESLLSLSPSPSPSLPHLSFQAVKTNAASSASWQDALSSLLEWGPLFPVVFSLHCERSCMCVCIIYPLPVIIINSAECNQQAVNHRCRKMIRNLLLICKVNRNRCANKS